MTRRLVRPDMVADEGRPVGVAPTCWTAVHQEHETVTHQCGERIGVRMGCSGTLDTNALPYVAVLSGVASSHPVSAGRNMSTRIVRRSAGGEIVGNTHAGWYDDGTGSKRWWDGEKWTDDVQPPQVAT